MSKDARRPNVDSVTAPPVSPPGLSSALERNIAALRERRRQEDARARPQDRLAAAITRFTGSMRFVWLHAALFGTWIAVNLGWIPGLPRFDPSFVILAMVASVEAIFLSTFVLISQNRMQAAADVRADLDLQINLLTEHELTRVATLVAATADRLGVTTEVDAELPEIERDVAPEAVLDELEEK
jgi:uncharacterized membrane protein